MRIALASFIDSSTTTGMGKWTERIAGQLRARGHEVVSLDATSLGLDLASSTQRHLFGFIVARRLLRERTRFDAVVVHEPHALPLCLICPLIGTAVVVMSHGVENRIVHELRSAARQGGARMSLAQMLKHQALWGWREAAGFLTANQLLCLSNADRSYLVTHLKKDPAAVTSFVNGADTVKAPVDPGAADGVVVLGTWIPEKGSLLLPRIWRDVRSVLPGAHLTVAGAGVEPDQVLGGFAQDDQDSVRVVRTFEGPDELRRLLGSAGVFLLPSLREGSPLALLEAMSHGLPVVASSVGGVPDIINDGQEGFLYSPLETGLAARRIRELLTDVDRRRRMGSAARVRAGECTWEAASTTVEQACKRAIGI